MPRTALSNNVTSQARDCALKQSSIATLACGIEHRAKNQELTIGLSQQLAVRYPETGQKLLHAAASVKKVEQDACVRTLELQTGRASKVPRARHRALVNGFLAKLALGETARRSKCVRLSNYYQVNPPKNLGGFLERLSVQFALSSEPYNQAWFEAVLSTVRQLELLCECDPQGLEQLIRERFGNGSLVYHRRVYEGLEKFLCKRRSDIPPGFVFLNIFECGKHWVDNRTLQATLKLKPLVNIMRANSGSCASESAWPIFIGWCYDHDVLGALGSGYLLTEEQVPRPIKERVEARVEKWPKLQVSQRIKEQVEARLKKWPELLRIVAENWGGMLTALTVASQSNEFAEEQLSLVLAKKLIKSTKTLNELYICLDAVTHWTLRNEKHGFLDHWSILEPVQSWIRERALEISKTSEFQSELTKWVEQADAGQDRVEASRRIREWMEDPKDSLDLTGLNLTKIPDYFEVLSEIWWRSSNYGPRFEPWQLFPYPSDPQLHALRTVIIYARKEDPLLAREQQRN